ncbi:hypothetical protein K438DRAFT_1996229 [Mycena galopus ATCC 62051]|nr:hypothetical protein K438DRAFT_1996229 [Mycena galopus ATCC 62051]
MLILDSPQTALVLAQQSKALSGVRMSDASLRNSAKIATYISRKGDLIALARNGENWLPGLLQLTCGRGMDSISPTGFVPSGAPMHDGYLDGMADVDSPQDMALSHSPEDPNRTEASLDRSVANGPSKNLKAWTESHPLAPNRLRTLLRWHLERRSEDSEICPNWSAPRRSAQFGPRRLSS